MDQWNRSGVVPVMDGSITEVEMDGSISLPFTDHELTFTDHALTISKSLISDHELTFQGLFIYLDKLTLFYYKMKYFDCSD